MSDIRGIIESNEIKTPDLHVYGQRESGQKQAQGALAGLARYREADSLDSV
jgi:hypothetical protein